MQNNALSLTALVFTLQAWLFSLLARALSGPIERWDAVDPRDVAWACAAVAAGGALLGALSFKTPLGKGSTLAGGLLLLALLGYLLGA